jgi:hypothetical protein
MTMTLMGLPEAAPEALPEALPEDDPPEELPEELLEELQAASRTVRMTGTASRHLRRMEVPDRPGVCDIITM